MSDECWITNATPTHPDLFTGVMELHHLSEHISTAPQSIAGFYTPLASSLGMHALGIVNSLSVVAPQPLMLLVMHFWGCYTNTLCEHN